MSSISQPMGYPKPSLPGKGACFHGGQVGKSQTPRFDVEDTVILSLVASFSLILFTVLGWAMWRTLRSIVETLSATTLVEIP